MSSEIVFNSLAWLMAISSGLMAGTYLTFSMVIMPSLKLLAGIQGAEAMNSINTKILKTGFMPLFFCSTLIAILLVVIGLMHWGMPGADRAFWGGLIYTLGMFVVTAAGNVPLNNELGRAESNPEQFALVWEKYLRVWTRCNSVRAVACTITFILMIDAI